VTVQIRLPLPKTIISEKLNSQYITSSLSYDSEYSFLLTYVATSAVISCVVFGLSYVLSVRSTDKEKVSAYECGFNPFEDARNQFDVRFYLVAILFIIFDLEVSFLFPWAVTLNQLTIFGFWSMFVFLLILTVGFVYEWKKGALEWE
jgi:NADH:ubiquinone oxidoreductase subunit 3 (subunit A)